MKRVLVVYHIFAHYRRAVIDELQESQVYHYEFAGDTKDVEGVKALKAEEFTHFFPISFRKISSFGLQWGLLRLALTGKFDAYIFLANPNFLTTWLSAAIVRIRAKRVLFWTHGWLKPEPLLKRWLRRAFFSLADGVMVYGERARNMGISNGYPSDKVSVIYNSLDYQAASRVLAKLDEGKSIAMPQALFSNPSLPILICTARLISACRFDLLLEAAVLLREAGREVNILLVGDGPERQRLEEIALKHNLNVNFWGACYDEEMLGNLIYHSDITVSPGKIGLTVIHSLTYGTPAITHSDFDNQMPEVEAIEAGLTGAFFERDNVQSLKDAISRWLDAGIDRADVRKACLAAIASKWNPTRQRQAIEDALQRVFER